jgi:hypothetical protein
VTHAASFVGRLRAEAESAAAAEAAFRSKAAEKIALLERERAFAFRRFNLMRAVADGVASAEDEEIATAAGVSILRSRLDWTGGGDTQAAILSQFAAVARALYLCRTEDIETEMSDAAAQALAEFEAWYEQTRGTPFWDLFDQPIEDTPRVDF